MSFTASLSDIVAANANGLLGSKPSWPRMRLGEVCSILNGAPFASELFSASEGTPLIRIRDLLRGRTETYFNGRFDPQYVVNRTDLLVGMDGDFNCTLWPGEAALLNQRVCKIAPDERRIDRRFLRYVLPGYLSAINANTSAITVKHLSSRTLAEVPLPVPPLDEQRRLTGYLDEQLSRLDASVAALHRVQANLKRYRASVLKAACEGRLVPTEAELAREEGRDFENGVELLRRILAERRSRAEGKGKYKEPLNPDQRRSPQLPDGWCHATLEQLSSHITSGSRDWSPFYDRGSCIFLMAQNVRMGRLDLTVKQRVDPPKDDASRARSQVEVDDLLITIVGANAGDICRVPTGLPEHFVCQSVALVRPVRSTTSRYLEAFLLASENGQKQFESFMYGQGRPHLSFDQLRATVVPLPPLAEQHRIFAEADRRLSLIRVAEAQATANLARAQRLRQSILQAAFAAPASAGQ